MALSPLLPPLPTLTLGSTQLTDPPEKPPEPTLLKPFPEDTKYRVPGNPFRGPLSQKLKADHQKSLKEAVDLIRAPFLFELKEPISFNGGAVGVDTTTDDFNAALITVIAAIERGYYSSREPNPLGPTDWARLSCSVLAAIGRGYHRQDGVEQESELVKVRAEAIDPNPLINNPSLFHRMASIAEDIQIHISPDLNDYEDWYRTMKDEFSVKAMKAATIEVEEKFLLWKADHLDRRANEVEQEIAAETRVHGEKYLIATGQRLGLHLTRDSGAKHAIIPLPTALAGTKRSATGSTPTSRVSTPAATNVALPPPLTLPLAHNSPTDTPRGRPATLARGRSRAAALSQARPMPRRDSPAPSRGRSSSPQKRGRNLTPSTSALFRTRYEPLPRSSSPQSILALSPKVSLNLGPTLETANHPPPPPPAPQGMEALMASLQAMLGPAIKTAMAPYAAKLDALEKASAPTTATRTAPRPAPDGARPAAHGAGTPPTTHNRKAPPPQPNPTPTSYAGRAAAAANIKQPPPPPRQNTSAPTITEITVIRSGGHTDLQWEENLRERAADAIVRQVKLSIGKAVANPIPLKAGRWSAHPRSKGNFVYSFDGNVPFDLIATYKHYLLAPFRGTGQLCPSMGWTRLLVHGVPAWNEEGYGVLSPEELLAEVRTIPNLKKAHLAMAPRWLKPADRILSDYSTITFAISDPDGSITDKLLKNRTALFGKEVVVQRWVEKPALVQCSHCHALGHIKTSKACPLGKDSVRCHKCGGSHHSDKHDKACLRKHTVAGLCDCKFKCLNCHNLGHNCRDARCPARDLFRPRPKRGPRRHKNNGKGKEIDSEEHPIAGPSNATLEEVIDLDDDLYNPPPLPPNPTAAQVRTALHHKSIANLCRSINQDMEVDHPGDIPVSTYDNEEFPEALNRGPPVSAISGGPAAQPVDYSPSCPQSGIANATHA